MLIRAEFSDTSEAVCGRKRLVEAKDAVRVVACLNAREAFVVGSVIRTCPIGEVGSGKLGKTPPEPCGRTIAHDRASHSRAASRSLPEARASRTTACLSRKCSVRWGNAVAAARVRLYAPPQGVKSSSRAWPGSWPAAKASTSYAIVSGGSGRRKNSDLLSITLGREGSTCDASPCCSAPGACSARNRLAAP
jgi:hypothetical protein